MKFFEELNENIALYNLTKNEEIEKYLNNYNLKVDWIGRIYTYIEIPNEFLSKKEDKDTFIYARMMEIEAYLSKYNITYMIYPITKFVTPDVVLVVFAPQNKYFNIKNVFLIILLISLIIGALLYFI